MTDHEENIRWLLMDQARAAEARSRFHTDEVTRLERTPIAGLTVPQIEALRVVNAMRALSEVHVADGLRQAAAAFPDYEEERRRVAPGWGG